MESIAPHKKTEWVSLLSLSLSFLFSCLLFILSYWTQSQSVFVSAWHFLGGFILWFIIFLHAQQKRLAIEEEIFEQKAKPGEKTIFEDEDEDEFSSRHRLAFFEKWVVPIATAILGISFVLASILLFKKSFGLQGRIQNGSLCSAFLAGFAFFSLLLSKYSLGLAREKIWRLLRAGGSYLLMNALIAFACAVSVAMSAMEIPIVEYYLPMVISTLFGIIGLEMLLNLILDFYRPRLPNQEVHPPYDSRFLEICTSSKGILKTAAQTLDYQFGFKVSETWFYRFMEKAIAPLIFFQLLVLYLLTAVIIIPPQEQGILERFGCPVENALLNPGIHLKWPWPIETVQYYPVNHLQKISIGVHVGHDEEMAHDHEDEHKHHHGHARPKEVKKKAVLFTQQHGHEDEYFMTVYIPEIQGQSTEGLAVDLISIDCFLHYRIVNVLDYSYRHANPSILLGSIANREMTKLFSTTTMKEVLYGNRMEISQILQSTIQKECDQEHLGVKIELVGIENVHVPFDVAAEFAAELASMEEMQTKILEAEKYRNEILPIAEATAKQIVLSAQTYKEERQKIAFAEANAFKNYEQAYKNGKNIYLARKYLKLLEDFLPSKRVYVVDIPNTTKEVDILNLEDKLNSDLLQLDLNKVENGK